MKHLYIIILLIYQIGLFGQVDIYDLEETFWINNEKENLIFGKIGEFGTEVNLNNILTDEFIEFQMINDTIAFRSIFNEENPDYTAKFTIKEKTDSTLFLNLVFSIENKTDKNTVVKLYKSIANQSINQFHLKRISLISSGKSIIIDSTGNVKVKVDWATDIPVKYIDINEFGTYTGKLSDIQLYDLKYSLLRIGDLDEIDLNNFRVCSHCQEKNLEIEYNGEVLKCKFNWAKSILSPFLKKIINFSKLERLNKVE